MGRDRLVFYLGDEPVGRFRGRAYPTRSGRVEYEPYRGPGHAKLGRALNRGEAAGCWFRRGRERVGFTVVRKELVLGRPGLRSHWYLDIVRLGRGAGAEWKCPSGDDVNELIDCLKDGGHADPRKLRLYACAVGRVFWDGFGHPAHRRVVELAEDFADGLIPFGELDGARAVAAGLPERFQTEEDGADICPGRVALATAFEDAAYGAWDAYHNGAAVCGFLAEVPGADRFDGAGPLRDVFGNPFRPVGFDPGWRTADVLGLARGIYDDRAFDLLPVLADALMDAGCADDQVLGHCRSDGPHVRGCWVVDLVLGKA